MFGVFYSTQTCKPDMWDQHEFNKQEQTKSPLLELWSLGQSKCQQWLHEWGGEFLTAFIVMKYILLCCNICETKSMLHGELAEGNFSIFQGGGGAGEII